MSKEQKKKEDGFEQLEDALTNSEQFIEKNQKMIVNVILGLIVVIGIYFGYNKFISEPKATEAANQIFGAQNYFEKDSFNLALNGDGNVWDSLRLQINTVQPPPVIWQIYMPVYLTCIPMNMIMLSNT